MHFKNSIRIAGATIGRYLFAFYRAVISPANGKNCRFEPTCSAYAKEAYETHGILYATYLTLKRIFKCHPLYQGVRIDPVPPAKEH